jgi:adenosylhomocysteine nucleosidase
MHRFRPAKWGAADAYVTAIDSAEVGVVLTGVGPRQAALEASRVAWNEPDALEYCLSVGLAGALRPEYPVGQVLVARSVVSENSCPGTESGVLDCSAALIAFAADCGATLVDRFYSANHVVATAPEKKYLGGSADAVEMESFEILRQAQAKGVPAAAIRAVSDSADEDLPLDMNRVFSDAGQVSIPRVLGQVALHPCALPGLVKLGKKSRRAAESLAVFLDRYVAELAARAETLEARTRVMAR